MKVVHGLLACSLVAPPSLASAQGGATSSISGLVSDAGGGVLPGATVIVTSNATGSKFEAVSNSTGAYTVPALSAGVYTVAFSLAAFKTRVFSDVRVQLAIPTTLNASLDIGDVSELTVSGGATELISAGPRASSCVPTCSTCSTT
jgi:hypothetical protein